LGDVGRDNRGSTSLTPGLDRRLMNSSHSVDAPGPRARSERSNVVWRGSTVVVTGASGFLGSHLVPRLMDMGARVLALTRSGIPDAGFDGSGLRLMTCDMEDPAALEALVLRIRPDVVFHLGGKVSASPQADLVGPTFSTLLATSVKLLEATRTRHVGRLLLMGSTEEEWVGGVPHSPYGAAKAAMSSYARMYANVFETPVVIVRPTEVFGPGQAPTKLLPYAASAALQGKRARLSSGNRRGDWIYVSDAINGMLAAAELAPDGAEIDLGSGRLRSNREMVERLLAKLGTSTTPIWGAIPDRPNEPERVADIEHAGHVLGWRPVVALDEGLEHTADAARRAAGVVDDGPRSSPATHDEATLSEIPV
jgi:UDP-glucose 4-epimerase